MKRMTSEEIRQKWNDFFVSKGHLLLKSRSLIPFRDPSLLWINSGVATLKDYFSSRKKPPSSSLVLIQKCLRTNDIENVGLTSRHHTFFEMMGNFSIGGYFRDEALEMAYEFLFKTLLLDKDRIFITYYSKDYETYEKWIQLGISEDHLVRGNKETNFWDIGLGPCGPDTEIFYDRGRKYDPDNIGLPLLEKDIENDRYVEIWNIVFSQYNRTEKGDLEDLAMKSIDTGAGVERIAAILQDAPTNFDTDLFLPIINKIQSLTDAKYKIDNYFIRNSSQAKINQKFIIIADHIRAIVISLQDGTKPSNTARGYIIRRLIRRAYRSLIQLGYGQKTGLHFLTKVVSETLKDYDIDIDKVSTVIKKEENDFAKTIKQGEDLLAKEIVGKKELDFSVAFKLFETYGFPIELTKEILDDLDIKLDISQFNAYQEKHAQASKSRKSSITEQQVDLSQYVSEKISTFVGYDNTEITSTVIYEIQKGGLTYVLTSETPFYAKSGGQSSDTGTLSGQKVMSVFKDKYGNHWHSVEKKVGKKNILLKVDPQLRLNSARNHSATHLLARALEIVTGQTSQLGSDNNDQKLRFDFPLAKRPSKDMIDEVERLVNGFIAKNLKRKYIETTYQKAIEMGAIALEGEEYLDQIRVVSFERISKELCGGTHVQSTGQIEAFKIVKLDSKGSGTFRIEAITSRKTIDAFLTKEMAKTKHDLEIIIAKNKRLDSSYSLMIANNLTQMQKQLTEARIDNKDLQKRQKARTIDLSNVQETVIDDIPAFVNFNDSPEVIKSKAIQLREKYPDFLISLEARSGQKTIAVVASKRFDSSAFFKKRYPSAKFGGGVDFAMGAFSNIDKQKGEL